ncbi:hypothetical protein ABW21_db0209305 [Orbilia brochopaga]|nr:hypothetical protein ABW21_db0209305 [Drechslerella brochopaga]
MDPSRYAGTAFARDPDPHLMRRYCKSLEKKNLKELEAFRDDAIARYRAVDCKIFLARQQKVRKRPTFVPFAPAPYAGRAAQPPKTFETTSAAFNLQRQPAVVQPRPLARSAFGLPAPEAQGMHFPQIRTAPTLPTGPNPTTHMPGHFKLNIPQSAPILPTTFSGEAWRPLPRGTSLAPRPVTHCCTCGQQLVEQYPVPEPELPAKYL